MNINELRRGNIVARIDKYGEVNLPIYSLPLKVASVAFDEIKVCKASEPFTNVEEFNPYPPYDLCGIPLTEEWLKKLGFKISGETKDHTVWVNGFVFLTYSKKDDCYFFPINALPIQISCIHHLQNFYFLMTGKDLKFEL